MQVVLRRACTAADGSDFEPAESPQDLPDDLAAAMLARGEEWAVRPPEAGGVGVPAGDGKQRAGRPKGGSV